MKVLQINTVYKQGSTGRIVQQIQEEALRQGIENIVAYRYAEDGVQEKGTRCVTTWLDCHVHNRIAKYTHRAGFYSRYQTKKFLKWMDSYQPDIVHLHNLHGSFIHVPMLFAYLKKKQIKVVWTLHDCWSFTGNCPYFDISGCNQWENGCKNCQEYGPLFRRSSKRNWKAKEALICQLPNLTLVTPSQWLADKVQQSYLKDRIVRVLHNGIDLTVFRPVDSDFRARHGIEDHTNILLGVAFDWGKRKGLDIFCELSRRLAPDKYKIVLVGTSDDVSESLPESILCINRTKDQQELAAIYSAADLFVNPTREEVLGMVNIEANACGLPVVTFQSGGSPECICDYSGAVVPRNDIDTLEKEIIRICTTKPYLKENCIRNARRFDKDKSFRAYVDLYRAIGEKSAYDE